MTNATITTTAKETAVLIAYLNAGIDCNGADTVDAMLADNMTWGDVQSIAKATDMPQKTAKGVIASLDKKGLLVITDEGVNGEGPVQQVLSDAGVRHAFDLLAQQSDAPQPEAFTASDAEVEAKVRAPKRDVKKVKAGTKRAELLTALVAGATADEIDALCIKEDGTAWSKSAASAARDVFWRGLGYGSKVVGDKYFVTLPKGMKLEDCILG